MVGYVLKQELERTGGQMFRKEIGPHPVQFRSKLSKDQINSDEFVKVRVIVMGR